VVADLQKFWLKKCDLSIGYVGLESRPIVLAFARLKSGY
jgi:hypothetical protein